MPYKPKITTRGISTTTVTADSIPKNAAMTNNELDSNFLNLQAGTIGIKGTDSTVFDIQAGDTITFNEAVITTDSTGTFITTSSADLGDIEVGAYSGLAYSTFLLPTGGAADRDIVLSGLNNGKVSFPNKVVFGDNAESGSRSSVTGDGRVITAFGNNDISANDQFQIISGTLQSSDRSRIKLSAKYLQLNNNINTFIQATGGNGDFYIQNGVSSSDPTTGAHNSIVLTDTNDGEIIITPKTDRWVEINDDKIVIKTSQDPAAIGSAGDRAGSIAWNNTNLYLCTANYDGSTIIWKKLVLVSI